MMKSRSLQRRSLLEEMAAQGVRITAQRKVLIEIIQEAEGHLDAATLLKQAKKRDSQIDRATVYRTLELLKKLRLIDELDLMHLNGEKHFYEAKTTVDHVHLACFQCGRIEEFTSPLFERLKAEICRENAFQIRVTRLEVGGLCRECSGRNREASKGTEKIGVITEPFHA
jgi:Fur family ferric uptake transcriptional regulator